jgi:hypothetical protein
MYPMKIQTWLLALALLPGCGDDKGTTDDSTSDTPGTTGADTEEDPTGGAEDETKVPPTSGHTAIQAWLAAGHYKSWKCQDGVQDPIGISPHGKQRICSNGILSAHLTEDEYPVNSSAVKELYDAEGANIIGYAVYRHVTAGTTGANWYWYEQVPADHPAPHDANGVVADGLGDAGPALMICVGCHKDTGIDDAHPGHDFVYVQVK